LKSDVAIKIACPHDTVYALEDKGQTVAMSSEGRIVPHLLFEKE